jgi:excisionase family DNA binding protein
MGERVLTVDQLLDEMGGSIGRNTAYNLIAQGAIRHVRTGIGRNSRILIPESAVAEFLAGERPRSMVASVGGAAEH